MRRSLVKPQSPALIRSILAAHVGQSLGCRRCAQQAFHDGGGCRRTDALGNSRWPGDTGHARQHAAQSLQPIIAASIGCHEITARAHGVTDGFDRVEGLVQKRKPLLKAADVEQPRVFCGHSVGVLGLSHQLKVTQPDRTRQLVLVILLLAALVVLVRKLGQAALGETLGHPILSPQRHALALIARPPRAGAGHVKMQVVVVKAKATEARIVRSIGKGKLFLWRPACGVYVKGIAVQVLAALGAAHTLIALWVAVAADDIKLRTGP